MSMKDLGSKWANSSLILRILAGLIIGVILAFIPGLTGGNSFR